MVEVLVDDVAGFVEQKIAQGVPEGAADDGPNQSGHGVQENEPRRVAAAQTNDDGANGANAINEAEGKNEPRVVPF